MVVKSEFSTVGLAHKLLLAAEAQGHTAASLDLLAENPKLLADIFAVQQGTARIVPIETVSELSSVTPAVNADLLKFFHPRSGLWFYDYKSFTELVLTSSRDDGIAAIDECGHIDLPRSMHDSDIIAEYLGGSEEEAKKYALTLNQVKTYIAAQASGEDGPLLTSGRSNLFYVVGKNGLLCAVRVDFVSYKWCVVGWQLGLRGGWRTGCRFFHNKP